ncbi:MAG: hypothetical protein U1E36_08455 [Rickettsiales bacterium]
MKPALTPTDEKSLDEDLAYILGYDTDNTALDPLLLKQKLREVITDNQILVEKINARDKDVRKLSEYVETLLHHTRAIERSRAWWLGSTITGWVRILLGYGRRTWVFKDCERIATMYHHWKKARD